MGYTAKLTIHPDQVPVVNAAFVPGEEEIDAARELLKAYELQRDSGSSAFLHNGSMIDVPHIRQAQRIVALADELAASGESS